MKKVKTPTAITDIITKTTMTSVNGNGEQNIDQSAQTGYTNSDTIIDKVPMTSRVLITIPAIRFTAT